MPPVTESEVRAAVHRSIVRADAGHDLLVDEFVIGERGRIDIAHIGHHLSGFELKSDLDNLDRLPRQMEVFSEVFDFCTLVITARHLSKARRIVRPGWGLAVVERDDSGTLNYVQIRKPKQRRARDRTALSEILWRDELIDALESFDLARGYRSATRPELAARLATAVDRDALRQIVANSLMARQGWRAVKEQDEYAGTLPPSGVSSRFLARRLLKQPR